MGVSVEEWLSMVDFDTIRLQPSFQSNRLCLTIVIVYVLFCFFK